SSLAAVTILVWSTRLSPASTARERATCRALTTSSEVRTSRRSLLGGIFGLRFEARLLNQLHSPLDVQRRLDPGQRQAELDQRDGHGRAHADDDRFGVEDA